MAAEVTGVTWPRLLDEIDDEPPATIILSAVNESGRLVVRGVSHDNGEIAAVEVNGAPAKLVSSASGAVDWQATVDADSGGTIVAFAKDQAGNIEQTPHRLRHEH